MLNRLTNSRMVWLVVGLLAGLCVSYFWPHEPVRAAATDRNDKFALATAILGDGGNGPTEGIFALDFLTGRLTGAALNRDSRAFVAFYIANVAADFGIDAGQSPKYAIISGLAQPPNRAGRQFASSYLYIGELTTGQVRCYAIPYRITARPIPTPVPLIPVAFFQFREP